MASKVYWTRQARDDLRAIRDHIARDAPATAAAFVRRLRMSVVRQTPEGLGTQQTHFSMPLSYVGIYLSRNPVATKWSFEFFTTRHQPEKINHLCEL